MEMAANKICLFLLYVCCIICMSTTEEDDLTDYHESYSRVKRQLSGGMGGQSCLQIYTVPKQTVVCEPTNEVENELKDLRTLIEYNTASYETLDAKLDDLDPDKPKELPEEIKERLNTIDTVKENQAGHAEFLKRLETELKHVLERMQQIESSDRTELARLIELQTHLIQLTMHQSNASLHDEYVDKLDESMQDLGQKLIQLELDMKNSIYESESKLETEVQKTEDDNKLTISKLEKYLHEKLSIVEENLRKESSTRILHQNQTESNYKDLQEVLTALTSVRQHQALYDKKEAVLVNRLTELESELSAEKEERLTMRDKADELQNLLMALDGGFIKIGGELAECRNQTAILRDELKLLSESVKEKQHIMPRTLKVGDCQDALLYFHPASGIYAINTPPLTQPFDVYCEMDGQYGWTVIQRRQDGSVDFFREWQHYKEGFGDVSGEFWLGLDKIRAMTNRKPYRLRVDMRDWNDKWYYAEYSQFRLENEENNYKLFISGYHGDAGDSLAYHSGMPFSTIDRNNDDNGGICTTKCHGAWWYKGCFSSNLNGRFYNTGPYVTKTGWGDGVVWKNIHGTNFYSLKSVVMKIRPNEHA